MANSWNGPQLGSPIRTDVPELQKKLIALLKQDPTSVANIPSGAKRLVNTSGTQWQVQQYNGSSWAAIGKLMHDVDKLDGYHAAITPNANTVAVRNAKKQLEGDITGNAATASTATTLSETLPVNKGGTGATTSAAARKNLGVPPTSHASSSTTYGLGSNANYGHVRGDGVTTNVVSGEVVAKDVAIGGDSADLASVRGQIGAPKNLPAETDANSLTKAGFYQINTGGLNLPDTAAYFLHVYQREASATNRFYVQVAWKIINTKKLSFRSFDHSTDTWTEWVDVVTRDDLATSSTPGIVKPGTGMTVGSDGALNVATASTSMAGIVKLDNTVTSTSKTQAATANAVKMAYDKAVNALPVGALHASFASSISGCLLCNGAAVSRTTYADLFAIIGTAFGKGNNSTTFNLPDFRNKTLWGAKGNLNKVIAAGLPNIEGEVNLSNSQVGVSARDTTGCFSSSGEYPRGYNNASATQTQTNLKIDASRSSSIYGKSKTVQPPAIAVNIFIKY